MTKISLPGRVLFMPENPELVRRQLADEDLSFAQCSPLRRKVPSREWLELKVAWSPT